MIGNSRARFAIGFITGAALALVLNLFPYWKSYGAFRSDGYEVVGFPLTFRRFGGYSPIYEFRYDFFLSDMAVALAIAFAFGVASMRLLHVLRRRSGRGFPAVARSDGGPAAT